MLSIFILNYVTVGLVVKFNVALDDENGNPSSFSVSMYIKPAKQAVKKQAMLPAIHDVMTSFAKSFRLEGISAPRPDKVIPTVVGFENPQSAYVAIVSAFLDIWLALMYEPSLW